MTCETLLLVLLTSICSCIDIACCVLSPHASVVYFFLVLVFISIIAFAASIGVHFWFQPNYLKAIKAYSILRVTLDALILNGIAYLVTVHLEGEQLQLYPLGGLILVSLLLHTLQIPCVNRLVAKREANGQENERKTADDSNIPYGALP
ncbi:unnamed protein product [Bursaphelenchus xylophilus]|uniref:(pine wood nematode) hypothetical protein n=1 Tax=Bursaphelenchus xylophilus TaxID=6326 RepID=A0A1I7S4Q1_BURXY|nr:unnamed protein product [Bursaphelenchus xylophilus]CAG9117289.1 unnamed protein product [Bursaphelenchus xylophilus]